MAAGRGVIASPRPTELSNISSCTWLITAPYNYRLKLTLLLYNVSGFVPCYESQVIVFDGQSSDADVLQRFCYTRSNTVIYTRGNHMVVNMRLPKREYLDFIAVYEAVGLHEGNAYNNSTWVLLLMITTFIFYSSFVLLVLLLTLYTHIIV